MSCKKYNKNVEAENWRKWEILPYEVIAKMRDKAYVWRKATSHTSLKVYNVYIG